MSNKNWITSHIHIYIAVLLAIQPVMDVASFWLQKLQIPTAPVTALRLALFAATLLLGFILSDRKKIYWIAAGICAVLLAGHMAAAWSEGYLNPFTDLANFIRVVQMPLLVLCFITFCRVSDRGFQGMQIGATLFLLVILGVEVLSNLTGTEPHTYVGSMGILGWFFNANCQSNNLSMLVPLVLAWQLSWKQRRPALFWVTAALGLVALFMMCTRLAYLGLEVACVGLCITVFLVKRADWKIGVAFGLLAVLFIAMLPISPMMQYMHSRDCAQDQRQQWLEGDLGKDANDVKHLLNKKTQADKAQASGDKAAAEKHEMTEAERQRLVKELTPIYEKYIPDFVEIFGAEKTMEMYNYTIDVRQFSALRPKKLMYAKILMSESGPLSHAFGLELAQFTVGDDIYDVENDFHGIYYLYGAVGLAAYLAFIAYFVYLVGWALFKKFKRYFTYEAAGYGIAFLMCMAHSYNTAGVLRRPNASILLSMVLAGIYYLVKIRKYPDEEPVKLPEHK